MRAFSPLDKAHAGAGTVADAVAAACREGAPGLAPELRIESVADGVVTGRARYAAQPALGVLLEVRLNGERQPPVLAAPGPESDPDGHVFRLTVAQRTGVAQLLELWPIWGGEQLLRGELLLDALTGISRWIQLPASERPAAGSAEGAILGFTGDRMLGWARYPTCPDTPIVLAILVDGRPEALVRTTPGEVITQPDGSTGMATGFSVQLSPVTPLSRISIQEVPSGKPLRQPSANTPGRRPDVPAQAAAAKATEKAASVYQAWLREHDAAAPEHLRRAISHVAAGEAPPLSVSIILLPAHEDTVPSSREIEDSLEALSRQLVAPQEVLLPAHWQATTREGPCHVIAQRLDQMIGTARGEYVAFVTAGDRLSPVALLSMAHAARLWPEADHYFSDEDQVSPLTGARHTPYFKGAPDIDLALVQPYLCRLGMLRRSAFQTGSAPWPLSETGVQLALAEALLATPPAVMRHVPFVLCHAAERPDMNPAGASGLIRQLGPLLQRRLGVSATADSDNDAPAVRVESGAVVIDWPLPAVAPLVSILIPTRDHVALLRQCLDGLLNETDYPAIEIIIIDNGSVERETLEFFLMITQDPRIRVVDVPGPFDFAAMNNTGAGLARGDMLLLLNNDIKIMAPGWLSDMVAHASLPGTGIVGARLLYADGNIQHAGVALGVGGVASHSYKGMPAGWPGHGGRLRVAHEVAAVTGACLLIRREAWEQAGGFSLDFPVAYNDIDLCLKVRAAGWRILLVPSACLYHLESASRGLESTPEKRARFLADKERMLQRWPAELRHDPFLGPNLSLASTDALAASPPRASLPW